MKPIINFQTNLLLLFIYHNKPIINFPNVFKSNLLSYITTNLL